jgi:hypothetical protein
MKTTVLLFCAAFLACTTQQVSAKIWRVNNNSNYDGSSKWGSNFGGTQATPVFRQINDAVNWSSIATGDTLHVEGSGKSYATATITKKLVIIGPGYFLSENPQTSTDALNANVGAINFNSGSDGSQLIGVNNISQYPYYITINVDNVVIKRCRIENTIHLGSGITNISILQCFFNSSGDNTVLSLDYPYAQPTDIYFNNNICKKKLEWDGIITQCNNNVFDGPANTLDIKINNVAQFQNNILKTPSATVNINNNTYNNISYCVSSSSTGQFGTANNNIVVTNISSIFVTPGSSDGVYQLKSGSVASHNGSDGTDRGVFGGLMTNRYTLSGLPPVPVIYQITPGIASPSTGLSVTIKARTIK